MSHPLPSGGVCTEKESRVCSCISSCRQGFVLAHWLTAICLPPNRKIRLHKDKLSMWTWIEATCHWTEPSVMICGEKKNLKKSGWGTSLPAVLYFLVACAKPRPPMSLFTRTCSRGCSVCYVCCLWNASWLTEVHIGQIQGLREPSSKQRKRILWWGLSRVGHGTNPNPRFPAVWVKEY